jgi:3',5'-cyclic AMP phosphodiesterase CpdA
VRENHNFDAKPSSVRPGGGRLGQADRLRPYNESGPSRIAENDRHMLRLAHFSDIHVTAPGVRWRPRDWFNKRMSAWLNLRVLGRGLRFRHTDAILAALRDDLRAQRVDHIIFSGDATALGFAEETARAAELLGVGGPGGLPGLAVPGNHDYTTHADLHAGHFEKHFAAWQHGERVGAAIYPFAQRVGDLWLVGVNSATPNVLPWDASGSVGVEQLERLEKLLARLDDGPRVLVTHYPVRLSDGRRENRAHALRDLDAVVASARRHRVGLWLHGHRHHPYEHPADEETPFAHICAGSATQRGAWSYRVYAIDGPHLAATRREYDPATNSFRDTSRFLTRLTPS